MQNNELLQACEEFLSGWSHFLNCINFDKTFFDAKALRWFNEAPEKIDAAVKKLKDG